MDGPGAERAVVRGAIGMGMLLAGALMLLGAVPALLWACVRPRRLHLSNPKGKASAD